MGPSSVESRAQSAWLFRKNIADPTPARWTHALRVRLWKPRGPARQDPALEAQTERPGDQAGTWSQRARCPLRRPVVEEGAAETSDSDSLSAALNASLEPDRGSRYRSRASSAALRRVPTCWLQGTKPRARLVRTAQALGQEGARVAARRGGHSADGGSRRAAVGTSRLPAERTAPGAARGGAKEKVSPGPGQSRRALVPLGLAGAGDSVCGRVGARPSEAGRRVARRPVGTPLPEALTLGGQSESEDHRGAPATTRGTTWE